MIKLATVIVNWNQSQLTISSLNSIFNSKFSAEIDHSIYVVDNGSNPVELNLLQTHVQQHSNFHLISLPVNTGFCHGYNQGIKKAIQSKADFITIANNDIRVHPNTYNLLLDFLEKNPSYSAVSPLIYFEKGYEYHKNRYEKKQLGRVIWAAGGKIDWKNVYGSNNRIDQVDSGNLPKIINKIDLLSGCFVLFRSHIISQLEGFSEDYYLYYEDADLFTRLHRLNKKFACLTTAKIWHLNSGSSGAGSKLHDYFLTRNRLIFGFRYTTLKTKLLLLKQTFFQYLKPRNNFEKQAIYDYFIHKLGKGSWDEN